MMPDTISEMYSFGFWKNSTETKVKRDMCTKDPAKVNVAEKMAKFPKSSGSRYLAKIGNKINGNAL